MQANNQSSCAFYYAFLGTFSLVRFLFLNLTLISIKIHFITEQYTAYSIDVNTMLQTAMCSFPLQLTIFQMISNTIDSQPLFSIYCMENMALTKQNPMFSISSLSLSLCLPGSLSPACFRTESVQIALYYSLQIINILLK